MTIALILIGLVVTVCIVTRLAGAYLERSINRTFDINDKEVNGLD